MDFSKIGSLSGYVKNMKLKTKWNHKKETGDFQSQSKKSELQRKNEAFKASYLKQREENKSDETLNKINNKIASGAELTSNEMKYLQNKNPILYQKLIANEAEKKNYEKELKKCKTKDEVEKLKMSKVSKSMSAISSVKSNPNIPEATKLAVAQGEMKRLQELEKVAHKFEKSGEYAKLPTDAEKRKAESDLAEAKRNEAKKLYEDIKNKDADKTEKSESEEKIENAEKVGIEENKTEAVSEKNAAYEKAQIKTDSDVKTIDDEMTKVEAELTPEAQKLKRSRAKAAYQLAEKDFAPVFLEKNK